MERGITEMTKYFKGYKAVALIQIFMSLCFFINPGTEIYGAWFGVINFFTAGILFFGSCLAYVSPKRWTLWLLTATMFFIIVFNSIWFISGGTFFTTGFSVITYDTLFVVTTLHFLGKGL